MIKVILPVLLMTAGLALAAELHIGRDIVTRNDTLRAVLKLPKALTGLGTLTLTWTDCYGRTVAVVKKTVRVAGKTMPVSLALARPLEIGLHIG